MNKNKWYNIISIIISLIALLLSFLSYQLSRQTFDYKINYDSFINTPAITEIVDSTFIEFQLNNGSELQFISIIFPNEVDDEELSTSIKPIKISKSLLQSCVKDYIVRTVEVNDSVVVLGEVCIPVIFNYSAIVFGYAQILRENRVLIFEIIFSEDSKTINFKNSLLISRLGNPLKRHRFFKYPFSKPIEERKAIQDEIDIQELISNQLQIINLSPKISRK